MCSGRRLTVENKPLIFNLRDACHYLHNTLKEITNIAEFKGVSLNLLQTGIVHATNAVYTYPSKHNQVLHQVEYGQASSEGPSC